MVIAFEILLFSFCVLLDKDITGFNLEKLGRFFFLMVDHACHIPTHPPPPVTPPGNSGDFNLKIMTGMLVVSLSGRNCRVWFHLGYSGR